ncbi:MAG: thioredoxin domain-containing protein [Hyphomonadaceae bacterium]
MRLVTSIAALACLALTACSAGKETAAPDSTDRMARSEVEAIVKDYLIKNPDVLAEAMAEVDKLKRSQRFSQLVSEKEDPTLGPKDAPITIVEYFDYNCPYCHAANKWVLDELDSKQGDVRVVFKEFPILRQSSLAAAMAALAANRQGKYREMHVALMNSRKLSVAGDDGREDPDATQAEIMRIAKSIGLNMNKFEKDMADPEFTKVLQRIYAEAEEAGIEGTPGFYINGEFIEQFNEPRLDATIEKVRREAKKSNG